jgi:hypothetical protein
MLVPFFCDCTKMNAVQCHAGAKFFRKHVLKMLDGRAREETDVVTIAWLALDHKPEMWSLLMAVCEVNNYNPDPVRKDSYVGSICDYEVDSSPKPKRYHSACQCSRRNRGWSGLRADDGAMGSLTCIVADPQATWCNRFASRHRVAKWGYQNHSCAQHVF